MANGCGIDGSCAGYVPVDESDILLRLDLGSPYDVRSVQGGQEDPLAKVNCLIIIYKLHIQ